MDNQKDKCPTIGIPRALLYHRFETLWKTYFETLGVTIMVSPPTNREILESGAALAIDETCLSAKIYLGHVQTLIGKCDYIFIPRYSNLGRQEAFCTRFEGIYDQTRNIFRASDQKFISCNVDVRKKCTEAEAYAQLGQSLGFSVKEARRAYEAAVKADAKEWKARVQAQEEAYKKPGLKILIVGHSYVIEDRYIGKPITDYLERIGVVPLRADITNRSAALQAEKDFSPTCRWLMSRELIGSVFQQKEKVDGVILLSAFPCGPDSMVNELLTRRIKDVPILNLVLDAQSGTAGVETRLESFIDIIRFKEGEMV